MPSSAAAQVFNAGSAVPTFNSAATASPVQSYGDYTGGDYMAKDNFFASVGNFFTGHRTNYRDQYDRYLLENERNYELSKINDARAWEAWLNSNKYQMAVSDLKKAGLNPWVAIQNGLSGNLSSSGVGVSGSTTSSSATKLSKKSREQESEFKNVAMSALKLAGLLLLLG